MSPNKLVVAICCAIGLLLVGVNRHGLANETTPSDQKTDEPSIKQIELIHLSHTDVGFTDHPAVCRRQQMQYLDAAIDAALATRDKPPEARFYWTAESMLSVDDWWQSASPRRREDFLAAVDAGQLDITALAMNNTPLLDVRQWQTMTHWLPEDLWRRVRPSVAVQNDVNGLPRAGAMALLDRGVHRLIMGINGDSGGTPFPRPAAFWWKMPDGRRMFVYQGFSYPDGFTFFEQGEWRRGPLPRAADTRYRPPVPGEMLRTDEASVRAAHRRLLERIRRIEAQGYQYPVLLLSITNQWRIDNDPPYPPLADFVATWRRLQLRPALRLTTAAAAMKSIEEQIGDQAPQYEGEWTDWWANGSASAPREVAASRKAKRLLASAESPLWGPMTDSDRQLADDLRRQLCLFDEHTWGSSASVSLPYALDVQGQFNEKAGMAFRPMALAEWMLGRRSRERLAALGEGLAIANPASGPWSGWVRIPVQALRRSAASLEDPATGKRIKLHLEQGFEQPTAQFAFCEFLQEYGAEAFNHPNRRTLRFWIEDLPGNNIGKLQFSDAACDEPAAPSPQIAVDEHGWPTAITWPDMKQPLFLQGTGEFVAVRVRENDPAPRQTLGRIFSTADGAQRQRLREELLVESAATANAKTTVEENPHTIVYTQALEHPRLHWAARRLEVWKDRPRATLLFRLNRIASEAPEVFFVASRLPCDVAPPRTSCGGTPFYPYRDQLPGTCRDYFAIDGWVDYATPEGHWLWVSRDAPLVTFGRPQVKAHRAEPPSETGRVLAMVFDNCWYTNFVADSHGPMEFRFDLAWSKDAHSAEKAAEAAQTLVAEPRVAINPPR
jgi:hypothetical protein